MYILALMYSNSKESKEKKFMLLFMLVQANGMQAYAVTLITYLSLWW